jgi:hypothetical protein
MLPTHQADVWIEVGGRDRHPSLVVAREAGLLGLEPPSPGGAPIRFGPGEQVTIEYRRQGAPCELVATKTDAPRRGGPDLAWFKPRGEPVRARCRSSPRLDTELEVALWGPGGQGPFPARTVDISASGALVEAEWGRTPARPVRMVLRLPGDEHLTLVTRLARWAGAGGQIGAEQIALTFADPEDEVAQRLRAFLDERARRPGEGAIDDSAPGAAPQQLRAISATQTSPPGPPSARSTPPPPITTSSPA